MHGLANYIQNTPIPQRNGNRGEFGFSEDLFGKSVNPSDSVCLLCKPLAKSSGAV